MPRKLFRVGALPVSGVVLLAMLATALVQRSENEDGLMPMAFASVERDSAAAHHFENLLAQYRDMTFDELRNRLQVRDDAEGLPFDPLTAKHFPTIREKLQLTDKELELFKRRGFVSCDLGRRYSFPSAYYEIYSADLPLLITTDSILHAMHRSYDQILMELEINAFSPMLEGVLDACRTELVSRFDGVDDSDTALHANLEDVDLYLAVAQSLLTGQRARTHFADGDQLERILDKIAALQIEIPDHSSPTQIFGGERYVDYSQFKPRGHYTHSTDLQNYFRCQMWLGRADTGWYVLSPDPNSSIVTDADRELRNAILMTRLLDWSGVLEDLAQIDALIELFIGRNDNVTPHALLEICTARTKDSQALQLGPQQLEAVRAALAGEFPQQLIRSQVITSPRDGEPVPPPSLFQLSGQRFAIDAFVLSHVVFDSIVFQGKKRVRRKPKGLDVMAALGNDEAVLLLQEELERWSYSANLMAAREFVQLSERAFWESSLYNIWLDALRTLDDNASDQPHFPAVMRTRAWQRKQLQTQLASWAELRHDTILYAKQSYTAVPGCEYPDVYVEPYPDCYRKLKTFAERAAADLASVSLPTKTSKKLLQRQVSFFTRMAGILDRLETAANKHLQAQPLTVQERGFLESAIDKRGNIPFGSGSKPRYDGWYCDLIYGKPEKKSKWSPVIADVHTDPLSMTCLEAGTGSVNLIVIAVDNEGDLGAYVGPISSYYEFWHPVQDRMTDGEWQKMVEGHNSPPRPKWIRDFQAPAKSRRPQESR